MQSNHAQVIFFELDQNRAPAGRYSADSFLDNSMVEYAAQALFELVFACSEPLDGKHLWLNCDAIRKKAFGERGRQ